MAHPLLRLVPLAFTLVVVAPSSPGEAQMRSASTSPTATASANADEQEIRRLQHAWMQAWVDRDRETLERILADDYVLIISNMADRPIDRASWLAITDRYTAESFRYDQMRVRLLGDVAVVSSRYTQKAAVDGVDRSGEFFLTDVWQKRDGRWQVVARYSARPEGATQSSEMLKRSTP